MSGATLAQFKASIEISEDNFFTVRLFYVGWLESTSASDFEASFW